MAKEITIVLHNADIKELIHDFVDNHLDSDVQIKNIDFHLDKDGKPQAIVTAEKEMPF